MHVGVTIFLTDRSIGTVEVARAAEERGFESLWLPEHTHIPTTRRTPYPAGEPLPPEYYRTHDPFVALTAAAIATERLKVATGICLVAQHDPIVLAKSVASLDHVSDGRFLFGIGYGWNEDEMEDHGVDPSRRRAIVREKVLAMKELWTEEEASFDGEFVHLPPSWAWPKPVTAPHPPIHIGGAGGPTLLRHVAEYADGWMPIGGRGMSTKLPELRRLAEEQGRDPDAIEISVMAPRPDRELFDHYESIGVHRVVLWLPSAPADEVLPFLDRYVPLLDAVA